jgi:NADPH-dependent glutamate synthase beta subunit-like oxidoreductase
MIKQATKAEDSPLLISRSTMSTEINKTGSWRFARPKYDEKTAPCSAACPVGEDIARIEMLAQQGSFKAAADLILMENPFPSVCGRVCFHPCETACNRTHFDDSVAVHRLERYLGDNFGRGKIPAAMKMRSANGRKVCIVGAGPSGLSAGYFFTCLGYSCDIFEARSEPGGLLRWGIPAYRLPDEVLAQEIKGIEDFGVNLFCGKKVDQRFLQQVDDRYDAFYIGCGHGRSMRMSIPGAELADDGLAFLDQLKQEKIHSFAGAAAVIGGGNTAVDVARSLVRMGARATIVYRRRRQDMPAFQDEIDMAVAEGVDILELLSPVQIEAAGEGLAVTLQKMTTTGELSGGGRARVVPAGGSTQRLHIQRIFAAIGAEASESWQLPPSSGAKTLQLDNCTLRLDNIPYVFGGDLTNSKKSVADAIASGKQAAIAVDTLFNDGWDAVPNRLTACKVGDGPAISLESYVGGERKHRNSHVVSYDELNTDYFEAATSVTVTSLAENKGATSFSEIEPTFTRQQAAEEIRRCFNCGICNSCDNCWLFCPEPAVVVDDSRRQINLDYCKGCGICTVECPRNAMVLEEET